MTTSMDDHDEEKKTKQSLFARSGKSEAEVTNNKRLRSMNCRPTIKATDRHEASRDLSAIVGVSVIWYHYRLTYWFNIPCDPC